MVREHVCSHNGVFSQHGARTCLFSHHGARTCSWTCCESKFSRHGARTCSHTITQELQTFSLGHPRKKVKNIFSHTIFSRLSKPGECIVFAVFHAKIFTKVTANKVKYSCSEYLLTTKWKPPTIGSYNIDLYITLIL